MSEPTDTDFKTSKIFLNLTLNPSQLEAMVNAIKSLGPVSGDIKTLPDTMVVDDKEVTVDEVRRLREIARDFNMLVDIIARQNKDWQEGGRTPGNPYMEIVDRFCCKK